MIITRASVLKRAVDEIAKQLENRSRNAVRDIVSRNVGYKMLYRILDDIDVYSSESRELMDFNKLNRIGSGHPINPSYIYQKYQFDRFPELPDNSKKFIKAQIYEQSQAIDAVNYASQRSRSGIANKLLLNIFSPAIANCIAIQLGTTASAYKVYTSQYHKILDPISRDVYLKRKKWITGLTTKSFKLKFQFFDMTKSEYAKASKVQNAMYVEMSVNYRTPDRREFYYKDLMDRGTRTKTDVPLLPAIYGWIKRRELSGVWRPTIIRNYRRYDSRLGKLSKVVHPEKVASPGLAAFMIANRMKKAFEKTGKLYPFGNMDKFSVPRKKFYGTQDVVTESGKVVGQESHSSIFTEILVRTLLELNKRAIGIESKTILSKMSGNIPDDSVDNVLEFKSRLMRAISAVEVEGMRSQLRSAISSLNAYVDYYEIRKRINIEDYLTVTGSKYFSSKEIAGMKKLAKKIDMKINIKIG